jgi:histidine ammonia-lyase
MAAHGARRLGQMIENLNRILGVELLCAAQGIDFRAPLATSDALQRVVTRVRQEVATMGDDRYLAPDLERAAVMIANGDIATAAGISMPELSI